MRAELRDALTFVFADDVVSDPPGETLAVDVARGGCIAATVLLNAVPVGATLRCTADVPDARWYRLLDVPVERNTGPVSFVETAESGENPYVTRRAPFRVFDALAPLADATPVDAPTLALYLQIPVAADAPAGAREITLRVQAGDAAVTLRVQAQVYPVTIPPVGCASFPYTNWFTLTGMATRHGLAPWSEAHWAMIARYAALMAHGRQNTFWVTQGDVFSMETGRPVLDGARLRRLVQVFTDAGLYYIEGGHFGGRTGDWLSTTFSIGLTKSLATSAQGNADIHAIAVQLMAEITANGWRDRWLQHVADEPIPENAADYRIFLGMVRKYMPGVPILDATMCPELVGSVDIWCPQVQEYQHHQDQFAAARAVGDRVWCYTCCSPGGPWLNRLLDMELLRPTLFGWAAAHFGLDGYLHWGLNHYSPEQDPFQQNVVAWGSENSLPAGDTHIVYPGTDGPWSSIRLEAQREGCEDYELLRRLQARDAAAAAAVIAPAFRAFDDYTRDAAQFRAARRALLQALAGNPVDAAVRA